MNSYLSARVACSSCSGLERPLAAVQTRAGGGVNDTFIWHFSVKVTGSHLLAQRERNSKLQFSPPSKMPNSSLLGALHLGNKSSFFLLGQTAPLTMMDAAPINLYQLNGMDS